MNTSEPTVSVIIPVFNRADSVVRAIDSVLDQKLDSVEIIVVDDGSSPPLVLPDRLSSADLITLLRLDTNRGASAARNAGAAAARGRWLGWLDSDDRWSPGKLTKQLSVLQSLDGRDDTVAVATGFDYVSPDGSRDRRTPIESADSRLFFSACWFCPGSTVLIARTMFEKVGPYDEKLRRLEDLDWFARFAMAGGRLAVVPDSLASIEVGQKPPYATIEAAARHIRTKFNSMTPRPARESMRRLEAYLQLELAASALKREKRPVAAAVHLARSFALFPRARLHLANFWR